MLFKGVSNIFYCLRFLQDELEALKSIYDGDDCFNAVSDKTFQYKVIETSILDGHTLVIKRRKCIVLTKQMAKFFCLDGRGRDCKINGARNKMG